MGWQVIEEPIARLADHGRLPISFLVDRRLDLGSIDPRTGQGGFSRREIEVARPFLKDYDAVDGEGPKRWVETWDVARWGLISASEGDDRVGGAVLAFDTAGLDMLEGRNDLALNKRLDTIDIGLAAAQTT